MPSRQDSVFNHPHQQPMGPYDTEGLPTAFGKIGFAVHGSKPIVFMLDGLQSICECDTEVL